MTRDATLQDQRKERIVNQLNTASKGKPATIIFVNTRQHAWQDNKISFEDVYQLAFPNEPLNDGDVVRVEYSRGANGGGAGSLKPGQSVNVKKDMVFDVYVTVRS